MNRQSMSERDLLLGVDVGTTGTKAALFDLDGILTASSERNYATRYLPGNGVEQNPEDWWGAVCNSIKEALGNAKGSSRRVLGMAVSAQAPTLLAVNARGEPLRSALIWMDRRADGESRELADRFGFGEVVRRTGNRPDPFYIASKLRWLRQNEPKTADEARWFLQINGFINHRLTGEFSLDESHAGLLQLRDLERSAWWEELLDWCGTSPDRFPRVSPGTEIIGSVTRTAAAATGLEAGTPVVAGTVDGAAAALEAGVLDPGRAAEMTGTSTVLIMPTLAARPHAAFISMPHAVPGRSLVLAAMVASGASLKWFRDELGGEERAQAERESGDAYELLTQTASQSPPGSNGAYFLPYMLGERSPHWHTEARGVFAGISLSTRKGDLVRAILEGAAFALRENMETARTSGLTIEVLRSVGGGAQSAVWSQIKADVLGIPIEVPEASVGAPFGDAVLAGAGCGVLNDIGEFLREKVKVRDTFHPNEEQGNAYTDRYQHFRRLYVSLKDRFDEAAKLRPFPSH